jgi:hypothetical protein
MKHSLTNEWQNMYIWGQSPCSSPESAQSLFITSPYQNIMLVACSPWELKENL